jgi:integrase
MASRRRSAGSLFRRRRAGELEDRWSISYHVNGRRVTERAYTDRTASEQLLSNRLRDAARDEVGLGDPFRAHRGRPIGEHVVDFVAAIGSRNRTGKHLETMRARVTSALAAMGVRTLPDLELGRAEVFLGGLLEQKAAPKTRDHYASTLRQFGAWLVDTERWGRNPFQRLRRVSKPADAVVERQALTAQQLQRLMTAAERRPVENYREAHPEARQELCQQMGRRGRWRAVLYLFAATTGLRRAECAALRWADLQLGENPMVTPRASTTKSRRLEPLPLVGALASRLRRYRRERGQAIGKKQAGAMDPVFEVPRWITEQIRKDASHAGLLHVDEHGRRLDFHSLRATAATMMARSGVPLQLARRLMRHSSPAMTARHYEKLVAEDLRVGAEQMAAELGKALAAPVTATDRRGQSVTDHGRRLRPAAAGGSN